jgi:hypothetical protein
VANLCVPQASSRRSLKKLKISPRLSPRGSKNDDSPPSPVKACKARKPDIRATRSVHSDRECTLPIQSLGHRRNHWVDNPHPCKDNGERARTSPQSVTEQCISSLSRKYAEYMLRPTIQPHTPFLLFLIKLPSTSLPICTPIFSILVINRRKTSLR